MDPTDRSMVDMSKKRLLTSAALRRLPALYRQKNTPDPLIYAKLSATNNKWQCYIAEGGRKGVEYEVFALFVGRYGHNWAQVPLRIIEKDISDSKMVVTQDVEFRPKRTSALVGASYVRHL
jgi:hypothetical protein